MRRRFLARSYPRRRIPNLFRKRIPARRGPVHFDGRQQLGNFGARAGLTTVAIGQSNRQLKAAMPRRPLRTSDSARVTKDTAGVSGSGFPSIAKWKSRRLLRNAAKVSWIALTLLPRIATLAGHRTGIGHRVAQRGTPQSRVGLRHRTHLATRAAAVG